MELFAASNQWATRPPDERFSNIAEMQAATDKFRAQSGESEVRWRDLSVVQHGAGVALVGPKGVPAPLSHYAFGQACQRVGAPASYLRTLGAARATDLLGFGMRQRVDEDGDGAANVLMHANGQVVVRAVTSDKYSRIWNADVVRHLTRFEDAGWRVPPARPVSSDQPGARRATEQDVLRANGNIGGLSIGVGDMIAPAGLYASNIDMFAFMVNEDHIIKDGSDGGLKRGFFLQNSEVGTSSLKLTTFLYRSVCGNHIVWSAREVKQVKVRHIGSAGTDGLRRVAVDLRCYADGAASLDEAKIAWARSLELGGTKAEVVEAVFAKVRDSNLTQGVLNRAYDSAEATEDNPRSVWGMVQGLTRVSQDTPYTNERTRIDVAAGKLMAAAF